MYYMQGDVKVMAISLRLTQEEEKLIKSYADFHGKTVSEFFRQALLDKIEDEYDLKAYLSSIDEFHKNPLTYSDEEVEKMFETGNV